MNSFLDDIISGSATRQKAASEEVIRSRVSETTARAVQQIHAILATPDPLAEFKISQTTADAQREIQTIRQECKSLSIDDADDWIISELTRTNMAIHAKSFIRESEKFKDEKPNEPDLIATAGLSRQDSPPADGQEETKLSIDSLSGPEEEPMESTMNRLSGSEEDLLWPSVKHSGISPLGLSPPPDAVDESVQLGMNPESEDSKDWLRDSDDEEKTPSLHRRPYPLPRDTRSDSLYRWVHLGRQPSSLPTRARERSKSPVKLGGATDPEENLASYWQRSPIRSPASQPVTGSKRFGTASQQSPSRRQQPRRKFAAVPPARNIKDFFSEPSGIMHSRKPWSI